MMRGQARGHNQYSGADVLKSDWLCSGKKLGSSPHRQRNSSGIPSRLRAGPNQIGLNSNSSSMQDNVQVPTNNNQMPSVHANFEPQSQSLPPSSKVTALTGRYQQERQARKTWSVPLVAINSVNVISQGKKSPGSKSQTTSSMQEFMNKGAEKSASHPTSPQLVASSENVPISKSVSPPRQRCVERKLADKKSTPRTQSTHINSTRI
jgi:hypothetical protein